jgi:hypothetical protein
MQEAKAKDAHAAREKEFLIEFLVLSSLFL